MNELFRKRYRVKSARLKNWDYSKSGAYFVTICTKHKACFFGDVKKGKMILSEIGRIVENEWEKTEKIRKEVKLDQWIVMPNHLHGILLIDNNVTCLDVETPRRGVSTTGIKYSLDYKKSEWKFGMLGAIINQFKSKCTKLI